MYIEMSGISLQLRQYFRYPAWRLIGTVVTLSHMNGKVKPRTKSWDSFVSDVEDYLYDYVSPITCDEYYLSLNVSPLGGWEWSINETMWCIYATPFWRGTYGVPVEVYDTNGEVLFEQTYEFYERPSCNVETFVNDLYLPILNDVIEKLKEENPNF